MSMPVDRIEQQKRDAMMERLRQQRETAQASKLLMVQTSARRHQVIRITGPIMRGGFDVLGGVLEYGPATRQECEDFIAMALSGETRSKP